MGLGSLLRLRRSVLDLHLLFLVKKKEFFVVFGGTKLTDLL